jgi:hypothetical protein
MVRTANILLCNTAHITSKSLSVKPRALLGPTLSEPQIDDFKLGHTVGTFHGRLGIPSTPLVPENYDESTFDSLGHANGQTAVCEVTQRRLGSLRRLFSRFGFAVRLWHPAELLPTVKTQIARELLIAILLKC